MNDGLVKYFINGNGCVINSLLTAYNKYKSVFGEIL